MTGVVIFGVLLLAALAAGALYVRLLNGPLSLSFLAQPIARSIASELPDMAVSVEDAMVHLAPAGGIEFRLRNVRFSDADGAPVAMAPLASVELSRAGMRYLRLAPAKVVLIEPRLLVFYTEESGLSLSFSRPADADEGTASSAAASASAGQPAAADNGLPRALRQFDLARTLAEATARARRGSDAVSYLRELGLRNATVIVDHAGQQTAWRVPEADFDLEHKKRRSIIAGTVTIASPRGPWSVSFRTEDSEKFKTVAVAATVEGLVPHLIAEALPNLAALAALDAPISGQAALDLSTTGELLAGRFIVDLAPGKLLLPSLPGLTFPVDGGRLDVRYARGSQRLQLAPSTLAWGASRLTATGAIASVSEPGGEAWAFDLRASDGMLAVDRAGPASVPIEDGVARGRFIPSTGAFTLEQFLVRAGGGTVELAGQSEKTGETRTTRLNGRFSPMSLAAGRALWPSTIAGGAHTWVGEHVRRGELLGGSLQAEWSQAADPSGMPDRLSLALEAADVQVEPLKGMAPVEAPRVLVRLEGNGLEVSTPEASMTFAQGRKLAVKGGRFTAVEIAGDRPIGEIAFRAQGPVPAALDFLDQEALGYDRALGFATEAVDGRVDGQFKISLPLQSGITVADLKVEGKARIIDGRAKQLIGNFDAQGASVAFDVTDKAIDARGEMLVGGVSTKVAWQRIFGAGEDQQPPLRITASLDDTDRRQLGLDVNHLAQGEIPLELTVTRSLRAETQARVRADLTNADLLLENLSWRKPSGRAAILQFDVAKAGRDRTELRNFKVVGDDIAIEGWMALDGQHRLKEFHFPDFSINVVSRLEIEGALRADNVWDVKARGSTYDGREFFKSLFSVGHLADLPVRREQPGLDLKADIDTVVGYSETSLRGLRLQLSKRQGKLVGLVGRGVVEGGKPLEVDLQQTKGEPRRLVALTDDGGQVMKLVGFYPNLQGGRMRLDVNLDGRGPAEKTGVLSVEGFRILGDPVVSEVLQVPDETRAATDSGKRPRRQVVRQSIDFDWMKAPFSSGNGQLVLEDAELRGPLVGATVRGKVDFRTRTVNLGGTYVPLQGLNSAVGVIPGLGQLFAGPRGEGVLGITFAIQGPMGQPQVIVNPLSLVAPGIFREMFQMTTPTPRVTPQKEERPRSGPSETKARSSSAPAAAKETPAGNPAAEMLSGWSSETTPEPKKK